MCTVFLTLLGHGKITLELIAKGKSTKLAEQDLHPK